MSSEPRTQPAKLTAACETWDLEPHRVSARARLYSIPPIAVGTAVAESLTSYVARLAEAHALELRHLMRWEVHPRMEPRRSLRHWALNGTGRMAQKAVTALEALTGRCDLRYLTFVPWSDTLNVTPMLRREKAWCPHCYAEWRRSGGVIYEPLLWAVRVIERCRHHDVPLAIECPFADCRARSSPLFGRSRVGYCSACRRWLGRDETGSSPRPSGQLEVRNADSVVGLLIEHASDGPSRAVSRRRRPATGWPAWQEIAVQLSADDEAL
jgi:TniQ protein